MGERRLLFDAWAATYNPRADEGFPFAAYDAVLDRVAELVAERSPRRVLELGIGSGNLTQRLLDRIPEASIVGVDFSPAMTSSAAALRRVEVVVHDIAVVPLPPQARGCDVAAMSYVLHELDDERKVDLLAALLDDVHVCVVGDVCFPDAASRDRVRRVVGDRWDPEEHYIAARELAASAAERGLHMEIEPLGDHAGVLVVER